MWSKVLCVVLVVLAFSACSCAWAQSQPGALSLQTKRVVVFKDGHALFLKLAKGSTNALGEAYIDELPDDAVLGTFWAASRTKLVEMRADWVELSDATLDQGRADSLSELLLANRGQQVSLRLAGRELLQAKVIDVLGAENSSDGERLLLFESDGKEQVAQVRDVLGFEGATVLLDFERKGNKRVKRLSFVLGPEYANESVEIALVYFRSGIGWVPTYRVNTLDGRAEIQLQAEITNDAEDIKDAKLDLVVGVPNFRFADTKSALTLEALMRVRSIDPYAYAYDNDLSNAIYSQQVSYGGSSSPGAATGGSALLADDVSGGSNGELYLFGSEGFSLAKGSRATRALWSATVPKVDIHSLELRPLRYTGSSSGSYGSSYGGGYAPLTLLENDVWHQLELSNDTKVPWTTGAAMVVADELALAQELLTYTPAGSKALLPVTKSVAVQARYSEEELSRSVDSSWIRGESWTHVMMRGSLKVENHREHPITLRVSLHTGGKVSHASDKGQVQLSDFRWADWSGGSWPSKNQHSEVSWELTVEAGQSKSLSVDFEYFAP